MFGHAGSLLLQEGFLQLQQAGAPLQSWGERFSLYWLFLLQSPGSRLCGLQQLWHTASVVAARRLQSVGISGIQALLPLGMWDHPLSGIEPVTSVLAIRFLTTGPPGKSQLQLFFVSSGNWAAGRQGQALVNRESAGWGIRHCETHALLTLSYRHIPQLQLPGKQGELLSSQSLWGRLH